MSDSTNTTAQKDPLQITINARGSYLNVHTPQKPKKGQENNADGTPKKLKYTGQFILDKSGNAEDIAKVKDTIKKACEFKWPGKTVQLGTGQKLYNGGGDKIILKGICLHDGTERDDQPGYGDGVMFVSANSERKPDVKIKSGGKVVDLGPDSGKPYSGCYLKVIIRLWAQDNDFGKRINCELLAVCFVKDGERLDSKANVNVEEEFADVEDAGESAGTEAAAEDDGW